MSDRACVSSVWVAGARRAAVLAAASILALVVCAQAARAVILPATTIDGPNEQIVAFGGVAMAEDGSGGMVYLKKVNGVPHVFVARYAEGRWLAPIRVDGEQAFTASWPRIAAANGGQLVVVWATPFATVNERPVYELLSATLSPGASTFQEPVILDPNIGEAVGTSPDIAMSSPGQAYVTYRVVEPFSVVPKLRAGDVVAQVRVARFLGRRWALLGAINRNLNVSMRSPTTANAPQVAIGRSGNGIVVWQEPEINGVARIWARRLFGNSVDYVLPVSATSLGGRPINDDADAPSVAVTLLGEAYVAYRQSAGAGSPLAGPRIFLNKLPDGESESGAQFTGAFVADSAVAGGAGAQIGPPSVDIDEQQDLRLLYDSNGTPRVIEGNDRGLSAAFGLGPVFSGLAEPSLSVMNPQGGGVSAWVSATPFGVPAVAVREDFPDGAVQTGLLAGGAGGPIDQIAVGRSGLGDGLVAFQQGVSGDSAIVATDVSAPPVRAVLTVPKGWIKPSRAVIGWTRVESGNGPVTYSLVLDGRRILAAGGALSAAVNPRWLADGGHTVQLLASDISGEQTLSAPSRLLIDGQIPVVSVSRPHSGSSVVVRVRDAQSGVDARAVSVRFGDGRRARGRKVFRHRYAHGGIYRLVARVRDNAGNAGVVSELVSVR